MNKFEQGIFDDVVRSGFGKKVVADTPSREELAWSCDERNRAKCRNSHGCHCLEITSLLARLAAKPDVREATIEVAVARGAAHILCERPSGPGEKRRFGPDAPPQPAPDALREALIAMFVKKFPQTFTPYGNGKGPSALAGCVADAVLALSSAPVPSGGGAAHASADRGGEA